jgi:hypothetical protein
VHVEARQQCGACMAPSLVPNCEIAMPSVFVPCGQRLIVKRIMIFLFAVLRGSSPLSGN